MIPRGANPQVPPVIPAGNGARGGGVGPVVQRWTNGLKTALLLGLMGGLILGAGALIGGRTGLFVALLIALAVNGYAWFNSDKLALRAMRAFPITETQAPQLFAIVPGSTARVGLVFVISGLPPPFDITSVCPRPGC